MAILLKRRRRTGVTLEPTTLPVRRSEKWIIGWKASNLVIHGFPAKPEIRLMQMHWDGIIEGAVPVKSSAAVCGMFACSTSPNQTCRCGFNAYANRVDGETAVKFVRHIHSYHCAESLALFRVALHGRVIEGTFSSDGDRWGYRAEKQIATDFFLPRTCYRCESGATGIALNGGEPTYRFPGILYATTSCETHLNDAQAQITLERLRDIADASQLRMHWSDE